VSVSAYIDENDVRYLALFVRDGRAPTALHELTGAEFPAWLDSLTQSKQRPLSLSGITHNGALHLAAFTIPDDGIPWKAWADLTEEKYAEALAEGKAKGHRPVSVSAYDDGGRRFTLVMAKDRPDQDWAEAHGLTEQAFRQADEEWQKKGYTPLFVVGYAVGYAEGQEKSRFLAAWGKEPAPR
jgi:hypothetical protein